MDLEIAQVYAGNLSINLDSISHLMRQNTEQVFLIYENADTLENPNVERALLTKSKF